MRVRIPNLQDFNLRNLPKLPKYGYAILASMGALFLVGIMGMCVLVALVATNQKPTPTPEPEIATNTPAVTVTCDDPLAPEALWQIQGQDCVLHEEKTVESVTDTLDMSYPYSLIVEQPFTKSAILNVLNPIRDDYWQQEAESLSVPGTEAVPWSMQVVTGTTSFSGTVTSMLFTVSAYTGGAHPFSYYETLTFDFANQRLLTLPDIFQAGVDPYAIVAPLARVQLLTQFPDLGDFINPGTEPTADNFRTWGLSSDSLILYFSESEVGPNALGAQTVTIPLLSLADSLKPEFVPTS
jgi:hypothetical protein